LLSSERIARHTQRGSTTCVEPEIAKKTTVVNEKLMEKQHPRQILGSEPPNNNAVDPSFKKKLD
jgi:hypothetical protein